MSLMKDFDVEPERKPRFTNGLCTDLNVEPAGPIMQQLDGKYYGFYRCNSCAMSAYVLDGEEPFIAMHGPNN